jgi:hypothetical protein
MRVGGARSGASGGCAESSELRKVEIMIRASSAEVLRIVDVLSRLLEFVLALPFPKAFLMETKFLATRDSVIMRGRDTRTKEIKTLYVTAGKTSSQKIRKFFSY